MSTGHAAPKRRSLFNNKHIAAIFILLSQTCNNIPLEQVGWLTPFVIGKVWRKLGSAKVRHLHQNSGCCSPLPVPQYHATHCSPLPVPQHHATRCSPLPVPQYHATRCSPLPVPQHHVTRCSPLPVPQHHATHCSPLPVPQHHATLRKNDCLNTYQTRNTELTCSVLS